MSATPEQSGTLSLRAYRWATSFLRPLANYALKQRLKAGKEDPLRIDERRGHSAIARPEGRLIWIHGASVGESLSILPLIDRLSQELSEVHFLVTTGTVTSASLMDSRLPSNAIHQYAPVDQPHFVKAFYDHWQPDCGLFVESELWPVLIGEAQAREIPLALINGRLSPKSFKSWSRRRRSAQQLLKAFKVMIGQDQNNADRIADLSGRLVHCFGNLKQAAAPLPLDQEKLKELETQVGDRPIWLAASTHPGEEELILDAHREMKKELPRLLTIIAPRHPNRGDDVEAIVQQYALPYARRSQQTSLSAETEIYLADTLGELGIFYRLSDVAFIGGSLVNTGGHNPMEPARLKSAIVTGPNVFNFQETFQSMREAGALALVRNERDLSASILRLLKDARTRDQIAENAKKWSDDGAMYVLDETVACLNLILDPLRKTL